MFFIITQGAPGGPGDDGETGKAGPRVCCILTGHS